MGMSIQDLGSIGELVAAIATVAMLAYLTIQEAGISIQSSSSKTASGLATSRVSTCEGDT